MDANHASSISGKIIADFEDDASQFLAGEPQFVPCPVSSSPVRFVTSMTGSTAHSFLSRESAALAKESWLRILKRFMEPVQGEEGLFQVSATTEGVQASLAIECRGGAEGSRSPRSFAGSKLDVRDDVFLTIFSSSDGNSSQRQDRIFEQSSVVPWAEIVSIQFERSQPLTAVEQEAVA